MPLNDPRKHHYAPQFLLRNFAIDSTKKRVTALTKHGRMAVWSEVSIESIGYEDDLYVHMSDGIPVSIEAHINRYIENPISKSETWKKISTGNSESIDRSDRPILYSLIRHLHARTPHFRATIDELAKMASDPGSEIPFAEEELAEFDSIRNDPNVSKTILNYMALMRSESNTDLFNSSLLMVLRSPIPLRSSTTPVFTLPVPPHTAISLPLPGMTPFQLVLTINPTTLVCLIYGRFDGTFINQAIDHETARGFNRHFLAHFAKFDHVRHLITDRSGLVDDMIWAPYSLVKETQNTIRFQRRGQGDVPPS